MKQIILLGTGIQSAKHLTIEAKLWLQRADIVLHGIADPISLNVLEMLNSNLFCLNEYYASGRPLKATYDLMVEHIIKATESYDVVCVAMYGHPGAFVEATHRARRLAESLGITVRMLPGISAFACLIADLKIDPSINGITMVEATDMIVHDRSIESSFDVIIWQVGFVGELKYQPSGKYRSRMSLLKEHLLKFYPKKHRATFYVASQIPMTSPLIINTTIERLDIDHPPTISTLYLPPASKKTVHVSNFKKFIFDKKDLESWTK